MSRIIKFDNKNFNKHTEQGMELLNKSVTEVGVIESITVSADDVIISGNARKETFDNVLGEVEPIIVETDGTRPVVLKRTDIKSGTKQFHEAAILANTTAKKNINLDIDLIQEIAVEEFNIDVEEIGVEIIDTFSGSIDSFFEQNEETKKPKTTVCPHCGKTFDL